MPCRRDRLPATVFWGFSCDSTGKISTCNAGHLGLIPELGRSPGEGKGYPLQYSGLENSMDCIVHGIAESDSTEGFSLLLFFYGKTIYPGFSWMIQLFMPFLKSKLTISFLYHSQNCLCVENKLHLLGSKLATLVNVYFSAWILKLHRG